MTNLADIVTRSKGKFITVVFYKKDSSIRTMNCRLGVTKYLKGGDSTLDKDKFIIVYDMVKKGYRAIDKEAIVSVSVDGTIFNNETVGA
jgi:hypothetical protein